MSKEIPGLHPRMPFYEAARPAITAKLDDLFKHDEGTRSGEDIEELHDMRVASRRLREVMDIFAVCFPPRLYRPLRKTAALVTRALGEVRDRDVLLEGLAQYRDQAPDEERLGVEDLIATLRDERNAFREKMLAALDEIDRRDFRRDLEALLGADLQEPRKQGGLRSDATLRENAQRICVVRVADFYGLAPAVHDPERVEELHELRIAAKHLRYALEIFQVCFGEDIEKRIEEIKSVQDQIGQIHDCDVLVELLRRHLSVVAQRTHEALVAIAAEALPHEDRMARVRDALAGADPRLGLLSLLGHKLDERRRRYLDFVQWWDEHESGGLRGKLYTSITAFQGIEAGA
jgi:CHAD domain-containing protein